MKLQYIYNFLEKNNLFSINRRLFPIKESTNNEIYKYGKYIIKISTNKHNLKYEYAILKRLEGMGKFPEPIIYKEYKKSFILILHRKVGVGLEYLWKGLSAKNKSKIIQDIVTQIKIIHTLKSSKYNYKNTTKNGLDIIMRKVFQNPYINKEEIESDYKRCLLLLDKIHIDDQCYIHNDLRYKNIILTKKGLSAIIDFENSLYGPRYLEYFRILFHKISAQNYLDINPQEYTEMEFLDMLIETLKKEYPKIMNFTSIEQEFYVLKAYLYQLSRFDESWYQHKDVEKMKEWVNFNNK